MAKRAKHLTEPYVVWVESEMARKGWKASELARQAKMNQGPISRMLRREVAPDRETLERLAKAFGKPLPILQLAQPPVADDTTTRRAAPTGGTWALPTTSEPLSPEEIATRVGEVVGGLIERLAAKGNGAIAAHWLLAVASGAQAQGINDVRPLIDLARDLMWREEHAPE